MKYYGAMWKNWSDIYGRSTRKEFWMPFLIHLLVVLGVVVAFMIIGSIAESMNLGLELVKFIYSVIGITLKFGIILPISSPA